jgi:hypothetical protein
MSPLVKAMKRLLQQPRRRAQRSAEGHIRIIRAEQQLARSAFLLAHYGDASPVVVRDLLATLWDLDSTTLYVQIQEAFSPADLVLSRQAGHRIVASGQKFRVETATHEPAPDGAYLVDRQYRQLGLYEVPPAERLIVALRITAGSGRTYVVDVPRYVSHATVVVNNRVVADAVVLPARGDIRYSFGSD